MTVQVSAFCCGRLLTFVRTRAGAWEGEGAGEDLQGSRKQKPREHQPRPLQPSEFRVSTDTALRRVLKAPRAFPTSPGSPFSRQTLEISYGPASCPKAEPQRVFGWGSPSTPGFNRKMTFICLSSCICAAVGRGAGPKGGPSSRRVTQVGCRSHRARSSTAGSLRGCVWCGSCLRMPGQLG